MCGGCVGVGVGHVLWGRMCCCSVHTPKHTSQCRHIHTCMQYHTCMQHHMQYHMQYHMQALHVKAPPPPTTNNPSPSCLSIHTDTPHLINIFLVHLISHEHNLVIICKFDQLPQILLRQTLPSGVAWVDKHQPTHVDALGVCVLQRLFQCGYVEAPVGFFIEEVWYQLSTWWGRVFYSL